jgi:hypothetical protein
MKITLVLLPAAQFFEARLLAKIAEHTIREDKKL